MIKKYKKQTKKQSEEIVKILIEEYKDAKCGLDYTTPFSLVVALILAAQCTDKRVNEITPIFFEKYKTIEEVKNASIDEVIDIIKPCGFYSNKAKSIIGSAKIVCDNFNGIVPNTMKELTTLTGIGRKSANIILQECFGKIEGIAVDTHVTRIVRKIGFSNGKTQFEIESELLKLFDKKYWGKINHMMVLHGRAICIANRPQCDKCPVSHLCKKND
ncbi:MAG: endonuclease III [Clostridia bacterium]|nr:endonuclease III [Clostridia bacterium]